MLPHFMGSGTRSSPIAIDDSEDEVVLELGSHSNHPSPPIDRPDHSGITLPAVEMNNRATNTNKKRKRENSFSAQEVPVVATSSQQRRLNPTLVNRLAQPESKTARKRRRRAERQALEDAADLQNLNCLYVPIGYQASHITSARPTPSWSTEALHGSPPPEPSYSPGDTPDLGRTVNRRRLLSPPNTPPGDVYLRHHHEVPSYRYPYESLADPFPPETRKPLWPQPSTSDWVSSMTMAADHRFNHSGLPTPLPQWSSGNFQAPLPLDPPPPIPPPIPLPTRMAPKSAMNAIIPPSVPLPTRAPTTNNSIPLPTRKPLNIVPAIPKPSVEYHALPSKPPPPHIVIPIGMQPDQDPNSKHGIFHITSSSKEGGSKMKNRSPSYLPNPAKTIVMEQLPKSHRQPDFINSWSRLACGAVPVHIFIDGPSGKALLEFATAEQARKAWASPKLGVGQPGLKSHQLKGKPRVDLIKVWWYRVDGIGAGSGVGEIEEGEIEGDAFAEKDAEIPKKETKRERKARLAKEREEKRLRESDSKKANDMQLEWQQHASPSEVDMKIGIVGYTMSTQSSTTSLGRHSHSSQSFAAPCLTPPDIPHYPYFLEEYWVPSRSSSVVDGHYYDIQDQLSTTPQAQLPITSKDSEELHQRDNEEVDMDVDTNESPPLASQHRPSTTYPSCSPLRTRSTSEIATQVSIPPLNSPFSKTAQVFVPRSVEIVSSTSQREKSVPSSASANRTLLQLPTQPVVSESPSNVPKLTNASQTKSPAITNRSTLNVAAPQPKLASITPKPPLSQSSGATHAVIASPASASSLSSSSSKSSSSTPVPSEPKAMKNAPTEPSYTKRALMARQKELEEKIAKSKMELAATTAANKPGTPATESLSQVKPAMDLGEKQAMEDRLRKLVLQSRKPAPVQPDATSPPVSDSLMLDELSVAPAEKPMMPESSTVSVSTHSFSLEDMAVSFITQTIETIKSQSTSIPHTPPPQAPPRPPSQFDVRIELAAKQKRLEEHISESKHLMSQLTRAKTREEKDTIMRAIREMTRSFEEASLAENKASSTSYQSRTTTTTQQFGITRWPGSCENAGVLVLSDDEDEDEDD